MTALATAVVVVPATALVTWWWGQPVRETVELPMAAAPAAVAGGPLAEAEPLARTVPAPALRRTDISAWAAGSEHVAATDLDDDGLAEIVLVGKGVRVVSTEGRPVAEAPAGGAIQVLEAFGGAVYAGWGRSKAATDATASVVRYTLDGRVLAAETVVAPTTERHQVVAISPARSDLLVAWFSEKFTVTATRATRRPGGWTVTPWMDARTAPVWLVADLDGDAREDLVVGRTYGDEVGSEGDATLVRASGERIAIPTTRGVRAGCVADTDGDGHPEVVLADGWDKNYGHNARAQIRLAWWDERGVATAVLDRSPGDYDVSRLLAADIDADGKDEILAVTNSRLRVVERDGDGWIAWDAAKAVTDAAVVDRGAAREVVVVGGTPQMLVRTP